MPGTWWFGAIHVNTIIYYYSFLIYFFFSISGNKVGPLNLLLISPMNKTSALCVCVYSLLVSMRPFPTFRFTQPCFIKRNRTPLRRVYKQGDEPLAWVLKNSTEVACRSLPLFKYSSFRSCQKVCTFFPSKFFLPG